MRQTLAAGAAPTKGRFTAAGAGAGQGLGIIAQCGAGVRICMRAHELRRAFHDDRAAAFATFRAEVDDPVRGSDHVQVVFDDDE